MANDDKFRYEKLQYDINREATKMSALSSGEINKYESFTGEKLLFSNQRKTLEQAKLIFSSLGKAFLKKTKKVEEQGRKQIDAITNQNKRLAALPNKDNHKDNYK